MRQDHDDAREIAVIAKLNGCNPRFAQHGFGALVLCGCADNLHGCDANCSIITRESAHNARVDDSGIRTLTRDDAMIIGDAVPVKGTAIERAAKRWGSATLFKCN